MKITTYQYNVLFWTLLLILGSIATSIYFGVVILLPAIICGSISALPEKFKPKSDLFWITAFISHIVLIILLFRQFTTLAGLVLFGVVSAILTTAVTLISFQFLLVFKQLFNSSARSRSSH